MEQTTSLLFSLLFLFIFLFLKQLILPSKSSKHPPSPPSTSPPPILSYIFLRRHSIFKLDPIIRRLHILHGPIFSARLFPFSTPSIFISSPILAHSSLVLKGATFADRPPSLNQPNLLLAANDHNISSSSGSLWRLLRRNLSSETLHQSRIRLFASGRCWALNNLVDTLCTQSACGTVVAMESFRHAISSLLVLMCFGEKLSEREIRDVELHVVFLLRVYASFNVFVVFPTVTKVLFCKRWEKIVNSRRRLAEIFLPLIRAREEQKINGGFEFCYVDSHLGLKIPEEGGRGLTDDKMVALCHEFLSTGIDMTTTALEWTMAKLTKNYGVQAKLWVEISSLLESDKKRFLWRRM